MLWHAFKKHKQEILILALLLCGIAIWKICGVTCLWYRFTGFPCPTCKMTRALLALARGDVTAYLSYNAMALPVAAVVVFEIFHSAFGRYEKVLHLVSAAILLLNFAYYIIRL